MTAAEFFATFLAPRLSGAARAFAARIVMDDPNPEYSAWDRLDGLGVKR